MFLLQIQPTFWNVIFSSYTYTFSPDRWDELPPAVLEQPGLYNHLLSFSAGPRVSSPLCYTILCPMSNKLLQSCIGMRFSVIEMKCFLLTLISAFKFEPVEGERVVAANV